MGPVNWTTVKQLLALFSFMFTTRVCDRRIDEVGKREWGQMGELNKAKGHIPKQWREWHYVMPPLPQKRETQRIHSYQPYICRV
mmetsp:Transcript_43339/g.80593  ORF Transcript_43339/g.80593 Transcript_43339/m.80593 type:complete len:84 (+) Transcript_43339:210-461(+)